MNNDGWQKRCDIVNVENRKRGWRNVKRKMFFFLASFALILIAACSHTEHGEEQAILNVKIEAKSPIDVNKATEIACVVTYGNEKVDDADEVKFEIWKQGSEKHEMLPAKNKGNGKYAVTKTFTEAGTYSIVAHVTARNMHNMPKTDIVVGNPSASSMEKGKGEYETTTTFKEKGAYVVKVHVETKDLHEHQAEQVTVQ